MWYLGSVVGLGVFKGFWGGCSGGVRVGVGMCCIVVMFILVCCLGDSVVFFFLG